MDKEEAILTQFASAVERLDDVLKQPKDEFMRDSAIQRFEFTFDLAWKALKTWLEAKQGIICASPKECFRQAYKVGVIEYDADWLAITDLRNETTHTYQEKMADAVYEKLPAFLGHFQKLLKIITNMQ